MGLVKHLGFQTEPFPMGGPENLAYLRSHRFQVRQYTDAATVPYWLTEQERGKSPSQLVVQAIETIIPGATKMSSEQLRAACAAATLNGFPLRQHGFWQVLLNLLSVEAYNLALAGGGFNTVLTNWNAAEAIPWYMEDWSIPPDQTPYVHLPEGYEALPWRLRDEFEAAGGHVHLRRELIAFSRREDGLYALTVHDHGSGRDHVLLARRLILAMPRRSLDRIAEHPLDRAGPSEFFAKPGVAELLATVTGHALYKFALAYPRPWWHELGLTSGDPVTDLPLRQIYYFETEGDMPGGDPRNHQFAAGRGLYRRHLGRLLGGVRDSGPPFEGRPQPLRHGRRAEAGRHLPHQRADGGRGAPPVEGSAWRARGAGALCRRLPRLGRRSLWRRLAFLEHRRRHRGGDAADRQAGRLDEEVYVCGESYSTYQGWVEGALQTAEMMLTGHFGLAAPDITSASAA